MIFYALSLAALSTICDAAQPAAQDAGPGRFVTTNMVNPKGGPRMFGIRFTEKGVFAEMKQYMLFMDASTYLKGRESLWKSGNPPGRAPVPFPKRDELLVNLQQRRRRNPEIVAHIKLADNFCGQTISTNLGDNWYAVITKDNDRCAIELIYRAKNHQNTWVPALLEKKETRRLDGKYYLKIGNHSEKMKEWTWDVQWRPAEPYKVGDECLAKYSGNNKFYKAIIENITVDQTHGIVYHIRYPQDGIQETRSPGDIKRVPALSPSVVNAFNNPGLPIKRPEMIRILLDFFRGSGIESREWEHGIHCATETYATVSEQAMKDIYEARMRPENLPYKRGTFVCYDFAVYLHAAVRKEQLIKNSQYPFAVAEAWTKAGADGHCLNLIINSDRKVMVFEPQNGTFQDWDKYKDKINFVKF